MYAAAIEERESQPESAAIESRVTISRAIFIGTD